MLGTGGDKNKSRYLFTIYTKDEFCGKGEYAEELDVYANTPGKAKTIAEKMLKENYEPGLRVARIEILQQLF